MTFTAVDHVSFVHGAQCLLSSVQDGRALGSLFSDFSGESYTVSVC